MIFTDKQELLAPAGNRDSLIAAVEGGADAVYIGGASFSARASAQNFSNDEIEWAVDYCHLRRVKVYVAINTLVSDKEFEELSKYIIFVNNVGADAIIVQDIGVSVLAREIAPELSLHVSTQASVYDTEGALFFEKLGFKRIVTARELSMQKIKKIVSSTNIEIEMFVHGSICISYSGQCLMSSAIGGRSGNRGKCAQPCRLLYKFGKKEGFLLSPKDMCLINHLSEIKNSGVSSLKIEGRMKGAEYVGTVTGLYRKYLDNNEKVSQTDYERLERIFFRGGFTDGYFSRTKGADMFCHTKPDNPYKMQSELKNENNLNLKFGITIECYAGLNKPIEVTAYDDMGNIVKAEGEIDSQAAINKPLTHERLSHQLSKLGDTVFYIKDIKTRIDENISIPVSEINSVRRKVIEHLEKAIIKRYKRNGFKTAVLRNEKRRSVEKLEVAVWVSSENQLEAFNHNEYDYLYIPLEVAVKVNGFTEKMIVVLPRITPDNLRDTLKKLPIKKAMMTNIGQYNILEDLQFDIYIDHTLNIFNTMAARFFNKAKRITLSTELMLSQIKGISCDNDVEVIAYGRLPLMITENCIIKSSGGCKSGNSIIDRTGVSFPIRCLTDCRNEILNSKPVVMSDKLSDIRESGVNTIRLMFTTETPGECASVLKSYRNGKMLDVDFTRGKFYKGV